MDSDYQTLKLAERTETTKGLMAKTTPKTGKRTQVDGLELEKARRTKKLKYSVMEEDWGQEPKPTEEEGGRTGLESTLWKYQLGLEWDPWRLGWKQVEYFPNPEAQDFLNLSLSSWNSSTTTTTESMCMCVVPGNKGDYCHYILELLDIKKDKISLRKTTFEDGLDEEPDKVLDVQPVQPISTTIPPKVVQLVLAPMPVQQSNTTTTSLVVPRMLYTMLGRTTKQLGWEKAVVLNNTAEGAIEETTRPTNPERAAPLMLSSEAAHESGGDCFWFEASTRHVV